MARPRAHDYDDKRRAILDNAALLFARNGFAGTSISQLSRRCSGSKALIYHYYESKEAILFDILNGHIRLLLEAVERAAAAHADPVARLYALSAALMRRYASADDRHTVLLNDLGALPAAQQGTIRAMERRIVALFADTLAEIHPPLAADARLRKPVAMSLLGMLNWNYTWFRKDGPLSHDDYARLATRLVLDGLKGVDGLAAAPAGASNDAA